MKKKGGRCVLCNADIGERKEVGMQVEGRRWGADERNREVVGERGGMGADKKGGKEVEECQLPLNKDFHILCIYTK